MNATIGIGVNERVVTVGAETVEPDAVATVTGFDHQIFEDTSEFVFAKFDELVGVGGLLGQELNDEIGGTFDPKPVDAIEVFVPQEKDIGFSTGGAKAQPHLKR